MPKRNDINKVLLIGSGPIIIGQACEFDYSGTQACKALKEEGIEVVLVNSNPATIMTDPEFSHRTYIEPLTVEYLEQIIKEERPDSILPTMGGQTALNLAMELSRLGVLKRYHVKLIGANERAIELAESREHFKEILRKCEVDFPKSGYARTPEEARRIIEQIGFPCIIRPSFTLGGTGASLAFNIEEFTIECARGLEASPVSEVLIEESVLGWKEYELELMRDKDDNVVVVCSIENIDPMGVHTGDSITVAPIQTLTDVEYQSMRAQAFRIIRAVGVDTGGSNIQFAVDPKTGRCVAIEMNPRVSRSSALASKATGFPIAKIATKLAIGYTLDEITNDITKKTPSCFEPVIDYVVTKVPRFAFEKFPNSDNRLGPQMKSVGEVMAFGRTFQESFQKALRSMEIGIHGLPQLAERRKRENQNWVEGVKNYIKHRKPDRLLWIAQAFREGISLEEVNEATQIDPWFLHQIQRITEEEKRISSFQGRLGELTQEDWRVWKEMGFSDIILGKLLLVSEETVRNLRREKNVSCHYKMVDTCAGEFESSTPYFYSTYDPFSDKVAPSPEQKKVVILGGGPNRIGQGIEFDYCCVQASFALKEEGVQAIMVNCNPETVSTDYDVSSKLYFEPLTIEDLLPIFEREKPTGVIVHFGGQTPLNLSQKLHQLNIPILGTSAEAISLAEDREKFRSLCENLKLKMPESTSITSQDEAFNAAEKIGYPLLVRPSYVLGGRGMQIIYNARDFEHWLDRGFEISKESPLLIDRFLKNAVELDVDALCDGEDVVICGMLEQIQEAGIHSGDSSCTIPPISLPETILGEIERCTRQLALSMKVVGLMNVQFAIENNLLYILEVNPRASRTIPFTSKAKNVPYVKYATKIMLGKKIRDLNIPNTPLSFSYVKESVFPFKKFPGTDVILGPEMRSTGEVMGIGKNFGEAYGKAILASGFHLPSSGVAFLSVKDSDKEALVPIAKDLHALGFNLIGTKGTAEFLKKRGIAIERVLKVNEGRPHVVDRIKNSEVQLVINTSSLGMHEVGDNYEIRRNTLMRNICYFTTITSAKAGVTAISEMKSIQPHIYVLQERS